MKQGRPKSTYRAARREQARAWKKVMSTAKELEKVITPPFNCLLNQKAFVDKPNYKINIKNDLVALKKAAEEPVREESPLEPLKPPSVPATKFGRRM